MTRLDLKTIDTALTGRARELVRTLVGRSQIAIETSADQVDTSCCLRKGSIRPRLFRKIYDYCAPLKQLANVCDGVYGLCLR